MTVNAELLRKTLGRIKANTAEFKQGTGVRVYEGWTTYDFPAYALRMVGAHPAFYLSSQIESPKIYPFPCYQSDYTWFTSLPVPLQPAMEKFAEYMRSSRRDDFREYPAIHNRVAAQALLGLDILQAGRLFSSHSTLEEIDAEVRRILALGAEQTDSEESYL
jgi:hypothetical protein